MLCCCFVARKFIKYSDNGSLRFKVGTCNDFKIYYKEC